MNEFNWNFFFKEIFSLESFKVSFNIYFCKELNVILSGFFLEIRGGSIF